MKLQVLSMYTVPGTKSFGHRNRIRNFIEKDQTAFTHSNHARLKELMLVSDY